MFTGITEQTGIVRMLIRGRNSAIIEITSPIFSDVKVGDSIAVNGACLTITKKENTTARFDAIAETLKNTTINLMKVGDKVNLEKALLATDRLSGHIVTGHVDGVGKIIAIRRNKDGISLAIRPPKALMKYIINKGSVAVDGISLTVGEAAKDFFWVSIIPHTAKVSSLSRKKIYDSVNIEADMLAKYAQNRSDKNTQPQITQQLLKEKGFI